MSQKERQRHVVLDRLTKDELRPCDASKMLGVSYRHVQRMALAYRGLGAASLVHGLRGRPGTHNCPAELKKSVLAAFRSNYKDFGPTLASEKLAENDGLLVKPETLRLWLIAEGDWFPKKRRGHHRSRRERRASFGDLIQVDGSHHDWFEKRGDRCCLMTMVDDATGRTFLLFTEDEGTFAVMATLRGWIETYGVPMALYTDRLKTYLTDREATVAEQLAGEEPLTQFGRACASLDIRIIAARSPQAKGRVENKHGLTQDRLVKELRLAGINTIDAANAFLKTWLPKINERFSVLPADAADLHRAAPIGKDLDDIFSRQETRSVGNDWVVRFKNRYIQIVKQKDLPPSHSVVTVGERADGQVSVSFKGRSLEFKELAALPERAKPSKATALPKKRTLDAEHPWRSDDNRAMAVRPTVELTGQVADLYLGDAHLPLEVREIINTGSLGTNI